EGLPAARRVVAQRQAARPDRDGQRRLREAVARQDDALDSEVRLEGVDGGGPHGLRPRERRLQRGEIDLRDRKSTRLNSSHGSISYAVFCLKKKKKKRKKKQTTNQ